MYMGEEFPRIHPRSFFRRFAAGICRFRKNNLVLKLRVAGFCFAEKDIAHRSGLPFYPGGPRRFPHVDV